MRVSSGRILEKEQRKKGWQREKLNCIEVARKVSANSTGSLVEMVIIVIPNLSK